MTNTVIPQISYTGRIVCNNKLRYTDKATTSLAGKELFTKLKRNNGRTQDWAMARAWQECARILGNEAELAYARGFNELGQSLVDREIEAINEYNAIDARYA